jgi:hypothetical protein
MRPSCCIISRSRGTLRARRSRPNHPLPDLANKDAGSIRKQDLAAHFAGKLAHFAGKLKAGSSLELVTRTVRVLKAILNFALDKEMSSAT